MNKASIFKFLYTIGAARYCRIRKKDALTVLSLHRISHDRDIFFNPITPEHFRLLLLYVLKHYNIISFAEWNDIKKTDKKPGKPYLILSFDDGYYDFMEYALPLLDKYKLPSNHNIVNSCANDNITIWTQRYNGIINHARETQQSISYTSGSGKVFSIAESKGNWAQFHISVFMELLAIPFSKRMEWIVEKEREFSIETAIKMMNWDEIIECTRHRVEIGSHTYNHDSLLSIKSYEDLRKEIICSKEEIEKKIQQPVNILALPNGQTNDMIEKVSDEAGMQYVLCVNETVNYWKKDKATKFINRITISDESPAEMFLRSELFHVKFKKYV